MTNTLKLLDCFSGIGGFSLAADWLGGFETVQFVELDPFCQKVLRKQWPHVPIHGDITSYTASVGTADVITAGFPCQDLSVAGKQAGLEGERSGLFYEVIRLARQLRPQFVVLENVGNLVSHAGGTTFQEVLFQLAKAGFDAEWAVIPAKDLGACHIRKRIWIVAHAQGEQRHVLRSDYPSEAPQSKSGDRYCADASYSFGDGPQGKERKPALGEAWSQEGVRRLSPNWGGYISKPVLCRGDDGLSDRVDRLKALGNAVVPQVAMIPLQRVKALTK